MITGSDRKLKLVGLVQAQRPHGPSSDFAKDSLYFKNM